MCTKNDSWDGHQDNVNPQLSEKICMMSQWFVNLLPNQAWAASSETTDWVCGTCLNQYGKLWTTMNISNRLVGLATKVALQVVVGILGLQNMQLNRIN